MHQSIRILAIATVLVLTPGLFAQDPPKAPDHGRVLACALDVFPHKLKDTTNLADTKNYVFRGKVISLGKDKKVSICYDTEHMRVAGAWVGKPIAWSADKNMGPTVEGEMLFSTKPGPGWADPQDKRASRVSGGSVWDDPREGKEGSLPHDWAHYKGLYVHGDKVVLSYTVGGMEVLEMPEVVRDGLDETQFVVIRKFNTSATKESSTVLLWEDSELTEHKAIGDVAKKYLSAAHMLWLQKGQNTGAVLVDGVPGAKLELAKGRVLLHLPALNKGSRFCVIQFQPSGAIPAHLFAKALERRDENLAALTKGGPPRWSSETLETTGTLGDNKAGPYTLDQIQLPEKNPRNASIRFAGLDFFPDGLAALCTWDGDVWIVSGLDDSLKKVRWKRFASGLQQPLGLKIIDGYIYTAGRDQITKLHDLNGDGEADFYENINNDPGLTLQRHEFAMDLQTDKDGNLYYCRSGHYLQSKRGDNCVIYKLSPDGKRIEKFAKGFREPNGLSIGPDGVMTVADNEGNGIPQTPIYRLKEGANYGFTPSLTGKVNDGSWKMLQQPIVWLSAKIDGSAGTQVWAPRRAEPRRGPVNAGHNRPLTGLGSPWGPLAGQLLHTSYGNCSLFSVLIDKTAEPWQAAVWKFPLTFNSGIMRARFNPKDGQLYVCGLRGWGTSAVKDGQFARVRYTGKDLPIPVGYRVVRTGIEITFSGPLDKKATEDDDNWAGTMANVLKKVPTGKETQEMPIQAVRLADDRKAVTIAVEKMQVMPNFALQYRIKAADGAKVSGELNGTVHRVP